MRKRARNRWERCVQILRWLQTEIDLPSLRFEVVDDIDGGDTFGQVVERGGRTVIQMSERACRTHHDAIYNLLHEVAHLLTDDRRYADPHHDKFWSTHGWLVKMYDEKGAEESKGYSVE